jgi:uncharacterized membrane protein YgcG
LIEIESIIFGGRMKKSKKIVLLIAPVLSTLLLSACGGGSDAATTRDVYQSREDCLKDWGDDELCQEMNDQDSDDYRRSGAVFVGRPFWGPTYYPGDRAVLYKGKTVSPTSKSTSLRPFTVTSSSSATSRSSVSSPRASSTSYGGFGGRSSGGGSSS